MKITKKVIGAGVILILGLILAIGYPSKSVTPESLEQSKVENTQAQQKAINNTISKYKTPRKKRKSQTVAPPSRNQFQDEGC